MTRNTRLFLAVFTLLTAQTAYAEISERVLGANIYLKQGNPVQAINTSRTQLENKDISTDDRHALLKIVARAEEMQSGFRHYEEVEVAIRAYRTLLKEFPKDRNIHSYQWKIAWLQWKNGGLNDARDAIRALLNENISDNIATNSWLMLARIQIDTLKYGDARRSLLQYGLRAEDSPKAQAEGFAWTAIIDFVEQRYQAAFRGFQQAINADRESVLGTTRLFSIWIQTLSKLNKQDDAFKYAKQFLKRYVEGYHVPAVRLIHADLLAKNEQWKEAEKAYVLLAERQAETMVGKQAFVRKIMMQNRNESNPRILRPVLIALKKLADENQLTRFEAEVTLGMAQIWSRIGQNNLSASRHALNYYAHTGEMKSYGDLSQQAKQEGEHLLKRQLQQLLKEELWLKAIVLWERFPQLRPVKAEKLRFGIAHALRMLLDFDRAEEILDKIYKTAKNSVWGQKVKLEQARLWLDRKDSDGYLKVMRWLNNNQFTLYRPEMMLVAAGLQLAQGNSDAASQALTAIEPTDLTMELRDDYWQFRAESSEALGRWYAASTAWKNHRKLDPEKNKGSLVRQADALRMAKEFSKAETIYLQVPEEEQNAAWHYHLALCEFQSGKWQQSKERLQAVIKRSDAGAFAAMARLELAEHRTRILLNEITR
ncbi:MAG: tetratricopeptide repeat protein [Mariprofundaceae bacterium]